MGKKKRFNYIRKKLAKGTWFRIVITVLSFALLVYCIAASVLMEGKGALNIGALGLTSVICALVSLFDMIPRVKDPERNYLPAQLAGFTSGMIVVIWIFMIVMGIVISRL